MIKEKGNVQRTHKDTLFRMLFREKDNLLSLYNALNRTSYTDTDSLEITTLENAIYMNNSKRHNKFLFPLPAKAIYEGFCRSEKEISNVVNYTRMISHSYLVLS